MSTPTPASTQAFRDQYLRAMRELAELASIAKCSTARDLLTQAGTLLMEARAKETQP